jgi:phthiocerol/phenolphthiocerol synthesis type-I polyketide synthase D
MLRDCIEEIVMSSAPEQSHGEHYHATMNDGSITETHTRVYTAGRLSYLYGLNGPSLAIDTACSSSLVAIGTARNALLLGVAGGAVAGGITLMLSPTTMAMYAVAGETDRP